MSLSLHGLGTAVPSCRINRTESLGIARSLARPTDEQDTWLPGMYDGTRIDHRNIALPAALIRDILQGTSESQSVFLPKNDPSDRGPTTGQRMEHYRDLAPELAQRASLAALDHAGWSPSDVTHLITVSCTGFLAPGIDRELILSLGLPLTTERTHVGYMGCHGALNGLRVARGYAEADPAARVLLCAVELCSLHYHYSWNPQKMIANALFADGAAAVCLSAGGPPDAWRLEANGSCLVPDSADAMTWTVSDHGFEMTLARNVPGLIGRYLKPFVETWLGKQGVRLSDIRSWGVHPGGPKILAAVEEALGLNASALEPSYRVLAEQGNMSSPTLLFILDRLRQARAERPCVMLGFGPGLAVEAALWR